MMMIVIKKFSVSAIIKVPRNPHHHRHHHIDYCCSLQCRTRKTLITFSMNYYHLSRSFILRLRRPWKILIKVTVNFFNILSEKGEPPYETLPDTMHCIATVDEPMVLRPFKLDLPPMELVSSSSDRVTPVKF